MFKIFVLVQYSGNSSGGYAATSQVLDFECSGRADVAYDKLVEQYSQQRTTYFCVTITKLY